MRVAAEPNELARPAAIFYFRIWPLFARPDGQAKSKLVVGPSALLQNVKL